MFRVAAPARLILGGGILTALAAMALIGAWLSPNAYLRMALAARFAAPDLAHWLGRDELGRDTLNRLLAGTTTTVSTALITAVLAWCGGIVLDRGRLASPRSGVVIGTVITALARLCFVVPAFLLGGGLAGNIVMAALCAVLLLPGLLAAMALAAYFGPGPASCIIAVGAVFTVASAYSNAMADRLGPRLPLMLFTWSMLAVSALDAAGLGAQPPKPSLGAMLGGLFHPGSIHAPALLAGACLLSAAAAAIMLCDALGPPKAQAE